MDVVSASKVPQAALPVRRTSVETTRPATPLRRCRHPLTQPCVGRPTLLDSSRHDGARRCTGSAGRGARAAKQLFRAIHIHTGRLRADPLGCHRAGPHGFRLAPSRRPSGGHARATDGRRHGSPRRLWPGGARSAGGSPPTRRTAPELRTAATPGEARASHRAPETAQTVGHRQVGLLIRNLRTARGRAP